MACPSRRLTNPLQGCGRLSHHLSFLSVLPMAKRSMRLWCSTPKIRMRLEELGGRGRGVKKKTHNTILCWFAMPRYQETLLVFWDYRSCMCWTRAIGKSWQSGRNIICTTCGRTIRVAFTSPTLRHLQSTYPCHTRLQYRKFQVYISKYFSTVRMVRHWNRCPKRLWSFHLWRYSKFNQSLSRLIFLALIWAVNWAICPPHVLSSLNYAVLLQIYNQ